MSFSISARKLKKTAEEFFIACQTGRLIENDTKLNRWLLKVDGFFIGLKILIAARAYLKKRLNKQHATDNSQGVVSENA